ncbi:MAG: protoporphyrinogen oxidase [Anaerolineae bacterium]|nr:protoporphyrinogen oxidase [Anaerolineae bacterium]
MRQNVTIIGGGITGLTAAYWLRRRAPDVGIMLIEASGHLGGKIGTERFEGFVLEWGPDCFLSRKPGGVALCEALGITAELVGRDPRYERTFVRRHGRLHPLPAGLSGMIPTNLDALTHSSLLSAAAVERIAQEPDLPPQMENGDESVADFVTRRLGREAFENLIEPLMGGIYAGRADQLSLAATFPQLRQLERKHGSLLKGLTQNQPAKDEPAHPPFVSFPEGMQTLVERLVTQLDGVEILLDTAVSRIEKSVNGYRLAVMGQSPILRLHSGQVRHLQSQAVILTTPTFVSSRLLAELDTGLAAALADIPYASTALVNLAFDEADVPELDGYGYVIPLVEGSEALACTWSSRKWHGRAPDGKVLLRVYIGRYGDDDVTAYDDGRLLSIAQNEIRQMLDITTEPLFQRIIRYPRAMPQYNLGHLDRITHIKTKLAAHPGLFMAGAAFHGVGIPDCIVSAETAVEEVIGQLPHYKGTL